MSTSTCKSNFLNGLIIRVLIFIFISPREHKQTFDCLATATGHYLFHVVQILCTSAVSVAPCFLGMVVGRCPRYMSIPMFQLQMSCLFLRACRTLFFLVFSQSCVTKSLKQDIEAPEDQGRTSAHHLLPPLQEKGPRRLAVMTKSLHYHTLSSFTVACFCPVLGLTREKMAIPGHSQSFCTRHVHLPFSNVTQANPNGSNTSQDTWKEKAM